MKKTEITLFTTHCPKCKVLRVKLDAAGINYSIVEDIEVMRQLGINEVPYLRVNGELMNFSTAIKWVNERGN